MLGSGLGCMNLALSTGADTCTISDTPGRTCWVVACHVNQRTGISAQAPHPRAARKCDGKGKKLIHPTAYLNAHHLIGLMRRQERTIEQQINILTRQYISDHHTLLNYFHSKKCSSYSNKLCLTSCRSRSRDDLLDPGVFWIT